MRHKRGLLLAAMLAVPGIGQAFELSEWSTVTEAASGQTVYWSAWGGDSRVNGYIDWVAEQVEARHDIELVHVKVGDIAETVSRILAEKSAGNAREGATDLLWINGENFAAMKERDLLYGPWAEQLPNFSLTAPEQNPEVREDFTLPVEGYEAPWGRAQLTFYHDSARVAEPPRSMPALLDWARENPGRFTYPKPPSFFGTSFLKQALLGLAETPEVLYEPVGNADFEAVTAPLWRYLDQLHPHLWREGEDFPAGGPKLRQLMGDGELSLAFTFTPSAPAASVLDHQLPPSTRSYYLDEGTLGNVHFVAVPFNAQHKAGALVVANFLMSPEAQAHKQDLSVWGDASVLEMSRLSAAQQQRFEPESRAAESLPPQSAGTLLREPHPSWVESLEAAWRQRYANP